MHAYTLSGLHCESDVFILWKNLQIDNIDYNFHNKVNIGSLFLIVFQRQWSMISDVSIFW